MADDNVDDWDGVVDANADVDFKVDNSDSGSEADELEEDFSPDLPQDVDVDSTTEIAEKKANKKRKIDKIKSIIAVKKVKATDVDGDKINNNEVMLQSFSPSLRDQFSKIIDFLPLDKLQDVSFVHAIRAGLPRFKKMIKSSKKDSDVRGCPLVLITTASAIRATEIVASISKQLKCRIAKLFAKHIKVQEHIELLGQQDYPIAIGTPNRLNKLLELGALSLSKCRLVLVDAHKNQKQFSVMTEPDISKDFQQFIDKYVLPESEHLQCGCV